MGGDVKEFIFEILVEESTASAKVGEDSDEEEEGEEKDEMDLTLEPDVQIVEKLVEKESNPEIVK